jgi:hypothetical protein
LPKPFLEVHELTQKENKVTSSTPSPMESGTTFCCICASKVDVTESVVEERPTGESWNVEDWYYCVNCWIRMKKLRQRKIDPEVLLSVLEL